MKKIKFKIKPSWVIPFLLLVVLIFLLPLFFINKNDYKNISTYKMELSYDDTSHILRGEEEICYYNNSENLFTYLYFHLYPNAFREGSKSPVVASTKKEEAYPSGESYGKIEILSVSGKNGDLIYEITGEDKNILAIKLEEEIYPDECTVINIEFETTLANINHRLGYGENTTNIGNFYPIACVYEDGKGFSQSLYHSNGDPFYSDCANYEVKISFDSKFNIASSGDLKNSSQSGDVQTNIYKGENIRDFCMVLSEKFASKSRKVGDVEVNYFGYQGDNDLDECLQVAVDALQTFNEMFGNYPYKQLSVVKSNFIHGGMEYPNIVLISDKVEGEDYNYVIVHEIAHEWWYAVVGNDEYNHAWQDEGLAEYSTLLFFKKNPSYGEDFKKLIDGANSSYKLFEEIFIRVQGEVDGRMERPLCEFETEPEYVQCTYTKGVLLFNNINDLIGEKKFFKALREYYQDFMFKNAKPEDLIAKFVDMGGQKIENIFNSWLNGKVIFK